MKILMISEFFFPKAMGGGELSAYYLAKELAKKDIDIHILTSHFNGLKKKEIIDGITIHRQLKTGSPNSLKGNLKRIAYFEKSLLNELPKLHKKENYDLVHCMNTDSIVAIKLKQTIKKPFIMHVNGPSPFCPKRTLMFKDNIICTKNCTKFTFLDCFLNSTSLGKINLKFYTKFNPLVIFHIRQKFEKLNSYMNKYDYYMAISRYMQKRLLMANIDKEKIEVIYNIIELDKFQNLKQPNNKIIKMLYLGELSSPKGPQVIIKALKEIKKNYEMNFYGDGIIKQELLKDIKKNNLNAKIHNKVSYDKIPSIIQKHDVLIFPSLVGEAFGRVALEANAAGKTVIASNIGGIPDVVLHNKTGYLFEPGNHKELAKIINKVIDNGLLNQKNIKEYTKNNFKTTDSINKVINVYKGLTNGKI